MPRFACITVDLDGLNCYRAIHGLKERSGEADQAYVVGVRRLLDLLGDIPATLFVIGHDVDQPAHLRLLREAASRGHELANHTFFHNYALRDLSPEAIEDDIKRGEDAIMQVDGVRPLGFRTPGYNVDGAITRIVASRSYTYDSSVFPCPPYYLAKAAVMGWRQVRGNPSRSAMAPLAGLTAPITPYRMDPNRPWRRGDGLVEVPMCLVPGARFPVIGTSLHVMKRTGFNAAYPFLKSAYKDILNLEFHAIDFMDHNDPGVEDLRGIQPDLAVPWESKRRLYEHVFARLAVDYEFATLKDAVDRANIG